MPAYDAFISYSHAKDKPIASALQSVVQRLGKPWYRRRASRVFRDDTSLSATPHLWPSIETALSQSRYLILIASPEAAASRWVDKECAYWLEHKSPDTLLIAVTEGALSWDNTAGDFCWGERALLPPALKGRFAYEPKWIDLTAYRGAVVKRDARFADLAADFASAIRGVPKEDLLSEEVRQQRRALTLAWSAAGSLLVLAGLAVWFGYQANVQTEIAKAQRDRAERTLAAATNTANGLVFDLAQRFRDSTGIPVSLVRDILDRALRLQDQLAASGENNADLLASESIALNETADTLLSVGDTEGAMAAARKALDIVRGLIRQQPDNPRWRGELLVNLNRIADVKLEAGDQTGARSAFEEAVALARDLAGDGKDATATEPLALTLLRFGDLKMQAGDPSGARDLVDESLTILRGLAKDGSPEARRNLAVGLERLANTQLELDRTAEALATLVESRALRVDLAADKTNAGAQRDLHVILTRIGEVKDRAGDPGGALKAYADSLAIARQLAWDKSNVDAQNDLAYILAALGEARRRAGFEEDAVQSLEESLAIRREIAGKDPTNAGAQSEVGTSLHRLGDARLATGDLDGAERDVQESLTLGRKLAAEEGNAEAKRDLAVTLMLMVDIKLRKKDQAGATTDAEEMVAIFRALADANPGSRNYLMAGLARLGDVKFHGGDNAGALAAMNEGLTIARKLAAADPSNAEVQRNVSVSLEWIGDVQLHVKDYPAALASYQECVAIRSKLAENAENTQARHDLAVCFDKVGETRLAAGDREGALAAYEQGLAIRQALAQDQGDTRAQRDLTASLKKVSDLKERQ
jgi:tetratricopeptide (TPR) repeat protein